MKTLIALLALIPLTAFAAETRPNIIVIVADDLRWDALGYAGNRIVQTPNLDELARKGVQFRKHFVTSSICNVSRATMFTGQYLRRHHIYEFDTPFTPEQWKQCYPKLLRDAGYRTGFIGKFGVGNSNFIASMAKEFDYWRGLPGQAGLFFQNNNPNTRHKTARFGDQALAFIRSNDVHHPFCLSISFNAPHARDRQPREFWPDPRDENLYVTAKIPVPRKATDELFQKLPEVAKKSMGRDRWALRFDTPEKFQSIVKDYYRLMTGIDREVGRIMQTLKELGLRDNTVIIFTSDNGFFFGERGMADKWLMYEESIRVPMLVFDPREHKPRTAEALTLNIDLAPTILDFAAVSIPKEMQGRSLLPFIHGRRVSDWRRDFFYEHHTMTKVIPELEGVRTERWKYVRWVTTLPLFEELFDLQKDPDELQNLAAEPRFQKQLNILRERWQELARICK
ncbi:MAG TPA: sulfatase [Verrucomicrobiae bacterium]|nr:sulfatase [Verrucomicrobiae bacterium]